MITFISAFRKFEGPVEDAQLSAMYSWAFNGVPVVVPDNEPDVRARTESFPNVTVISGIKTGRDLNFNNDCPLMNSLVSEALKYVLTPMVAIINSDIIILRDFTVSFKRLCERHGQDIFLTGTRHGLKLPFRVNSCVTYDEVHRLSSGLYNSINSADIFIASKENFSRMVEEMPPMVLGRYGWDNWIHFWAQVNMAGRCLNCTEALPILHCDHDHNHIEEQEGKPGRKALSSVHNLTHLRNMQNLYGTTVRINNWPEAVL